MAKHKGKLTDKISVFQDAEYLPEHTRQSARVKRLWDTLQARLKIGRPTTLTQELQDSIVADILAGNYPEVVCQAHMITRQTYYNWLAWSEDEGREDVALYRSFFDSIKTAEGIGEMDIFRSVMDEPDPFSQRRWILERRFNARYRQTQTIDITGDISVTSVSLPAAPMDFTTWLSHQLSTNEALKSMRTNALDVTDAELVDDGETLERVDAAVGEAKLLQDKEIGEKRGKKDKA